jgi:hypothetical protein
MTPSVITRQPYAPTSASEKASAIIQAGANLAWREDAITVIRALASTRKQITADDVWAHLEHPPEPRALGHVMRRAAKLGIITPTRTYKPSKRQACHGRPVRVWRSELYAPNAQKKPVKAFNSG